MAEMIFIGFPQRLQRVGSSSHTLAMSLAQFLRRSFSTGPEGHEPALLSLDHRDRRRFFRLWILPDPTELFADRGGSRSVGADHTLEPQKTVLSPPVPPRGR